MITSGTNRRSGSTGSTIRPTGIITTGTSGKMGPTGVGWKSGTSPTSTTIDSTTGGRKSIGSGVTSTEITTTITIGTSVKLAFEEAADSTPPLAVFGL